MTKIATCCFLALAAANTVLDYIFPAPIAIERERGPR